MDDANLKTLEALGVQLFELALSFVKTMWHLIRRPRAVFQAIRGPEVEAERSVEIYGDGSVGYTSPVLFVVTALALQSLVAWSASFYGTSSGLSEGAVTHGFAHDTASTLVFCVLASWLAHRRGGSAPGGLHRAFGVTCHVAGLGLFGATALVASAWTTFAASASGGTAKWLLLLAGLGGVAAYGLVLVWQLALLVLGFQITQGVSRRSALLTVLLAVCLLVPVHLLLYVVINSKSVTLFGRVYAMDRAAAAGREDVALGHLAYLVDSGLTEGSDGSARLIGSRLEARLWRRWLPALREARDDMASVAATLATTDTFSPDLRHRVALTCRALDPEALAAHPMAPAAAVLVDPAAAPPSNPARDTGAAPPSARTTVPLADDLLFGRSLVVEGSESFILPYPEYLRSELSFCVIMARDATPEALLPRIRHVALELETAVRIGEERMRRLPATAAAAAAETNPTASLRDQLQAMVLFVRTFSLTW